MAVWPGLALPEAAAVLWFAVFEYAVAGGFCWVRARTTARWPFYAALVLALLPLGLGKFAPGFGATFDATSLFGFLGISYLTFRSLDVVIGIQDGLISRLPGGQFLAYLLFFPTISAGPIDRYRRFDKDWAHQRSRAELLRDVDAAVHRIFTGFLYKFILAALIKQHWLDPRAGEAGLPATASSRLA